MSNIHDPSRGMFSMDVWNEAAWAASAATRAANAKEKDVKRPPVQMNPIEAYQEAGRKAGLARQQGDEARAQFHSSWAKKAIALESGDHAKNARAEFDKAYSAVRTPRGPGTANP